MIRVPSFLESDKHCTICVESSEGKRSSLTKGVLGQRFSCICMFTEAKYDYLLK